MVRSTDIGARSDSMLLRESGPPSEVDCVSETEIIVSRKNEVKQDQRQKKDFGDQDQCQKEVRAQGRSMSEGRPRSRSLSARRALEGQDRWDQTWEEEKESVEARCAKAATRHSMARESFTLVPSKTTCCNADQRGACGAIAMMRETCKLDDAWMDGQLSLSLCRCRGQTKTDTGARTHARTCIHVHGYDGREQTEHA
eukprot:3554063-Rhodomonas_salina.2